MAYAKERRVAVHAVLSAARLCTAVQAGISPASSMTKVDRSPVTVADFGAQAVISELLAVEFPSLPLVGEEDAVALRSTDNAAMRDRVLTQVQRVLPAVGPAALLAAIDRGRFKGGGRGRYWVLDPIDGTKGFLRGDQYALALALVEDGQVVLGVLGCPNLPVSHEHPEQGLGCLFVAVRGGGAWQRGLHDPAERRVRVDQEADPSLARICESVEKAHTSHSDSARVAALLGIRRAPHQLDSQCKYAAVARGDASIYLRLPARRGHVERSWDHAAGWAVVTEAGGRVSDMRGRALDFTAGRELRHNEGVVVSSAALHAPVLEAVQRVMGGYRAWADHPPGGGAA